LKLPPPKRRGSSICTKFSRVFLAATANTDVDTAITETATANTALYTAKSKKSKILLAFCSLIRTFAPYNIEKKKENGLHTTYRDKYKCLFGSRFGEWTVHL
jgi:hypothetical protein